MACGLRACGLGWGVYGFGMQGLNLPEEMGVMVLPDCVLFPHGGLPLYIFEERYRVMLEEALSGDCIFAVGRALDGGKGVSEVGTAGLVRASREREDGTSQLLLHGVIRVRFVEWLEGKVFPTARIEPVFCEDLEEVNGKAAMRALRGAVEDAIEDLAADVRGGLLGLLDQADDPGLMADLVAQQFVHDPDLRQELLETREVGSRIGRLCDFFEGLK